LLEEADIQYILVYFEPSRELEALDIFADNIIKEESTGSQDTAVLLLLLLLLRTLTS
jgi:hypothetical protein